MIKFLTLFLALILNSTVTHADENEGQLLMMGLIPVKDQQADSMSYLFRDEGKFVISTEKFKSYSEASKFCHNKKLELSNDVNILLLGITGASASSKIKDSISFDLKKDGHGPSGLAAWSPAADSNKEIVIMVDGSGSDSSYGSFKDFEKAHIAQSKKFQGLPAVCTSLNDKEEKSEKIVDSGREISVEKVSEQQKIKDSKSSAAKKQ